MGEKVVIIHSLYCWVLKIGCPVILHEKRMDRDANIGQQFLHGLIVENRVPQKSMWGYTQCSDTPIYAIASIQNSSPWHYINGVWLWIKNLETMVMPIAGTCRSTFPNKIRENYWWIQAPWNPIESPLNPVPKFLSNRWITCGWSMFPLGPCNFDAITLFKHSYIFYLSLVRQKKKRSILSYPYCDPINIHSHIALMICPQSIIFNHSPLIIPGFLVGICCYIHNVHAASKKAATRIPGTLCYNPGIL